MKLLIIPILAFSSAFASEQFVILSCMKSGTEYLKGILEEATKKKSNFHSTKHNNTSFGVAHLNHNPPLDCKTLLLIRDPRDVLISYAHYCYNQCLSEKKKHGPNGQHGWLKDDTDLFLSMDLNNRIRYLMHSTKTELHESLSRIQNLYDHALANPNRFLVIRFEELTGKKGGSSSTPQRIILKKIHQFLKLECSAAHLAQITQKKWGNSGTFRSGKSQTYKRVFDERLSLDFSTSQYAHLVEALDYK